MTPEQLQKIEEEKNRQVNIQALKDLGQCETVCRNPDCPGDPSNIGCFFENKKFLRKKPSQG